MLRRSFETPQLDVSYPEGDHNGQTGRAQIGDLSFRFTWRKAARNGADEEALRSNLHALVREAASAGTELVLMTYPSRVANYGGASVFTREVAEATNTRLVDLAHIFAEVCPQEPCPQFLLKDHHPNANGYRLIAETLVRELRNKL
jgi:lysophospholipase L1-like esterase